MKQVFCVVPRRAGINIHPHRIDDGIRHLARTAEKAGVKFELKLPHEGFNRRIGVFAGKLINPDGRLIDGKTWDDNVGNWLPSKADGDYIESLMKPCYEPGKFASWIAPPRMGINSQPTDYEYVKIA